MVNATLSIRLDRLSGSKTQLMTDLSKLVVNRGSAPLMAMPCPLQRWPHVPILAWQTLR